MRSRNWNPLLLAMGLMFGCFGCAPAQEAMPDDDDTDIGDDDTVSDDDSTPTSDDDSTPACEAEITVSFDPGLEEDLDAYATTDIGMGSFILTSTCGTLDLVGINPKVWVSQFRDEAFSPGSVGDLVSAIYMDGCYVILEGTPVGSRNQPQADGSLLFDLESTILSEGTPLKAGIRCHFDENAPAVGAYFAVDLVSGDVTASSTNTGEIATVSLVSANLDPATLVPTHAIRYLPTAWAPGLIVVLDAESSPADIVLQQTEDAAVVSFRFQTFDQSYVVDRITVTNCVDATSADSGGCDTGEWGVDTMIREVKLVYPTIDGSTLEAVGLLTDNTVTFEDLSVYVAAGSRATVGVRISTYVIDETSALSGARFQLNMDARSGSFRAIGLEDGVAVTESDLDAFVAAYPMTYRATKPSFNLAADTPSGRVDPGMVEILAFQVSADAMGGLFLHRLVLAFTALSLTGGDWMACGELADPAKWSLSDSVESLDGDWTFFASDGTECDAAPDEPLRYAQVEIRTGAGYPLGLGAGATDRIGLSVDVSEANAWDVLNADLPAIDDSVLWDDQWADELIGSEYLLSLPIMGAAIVIGS